MKLVVQYARLQEPKTFQIRKTNSHPKALGLFPSRPKKIARFRRVTGRKKKGKKYGFRIVWWQCLPTLEPLGSRGMGPPGMGNPRFTRKPKDLSAVCCGCCGIKFLFKIKANKQARKPQSRSHFTGFARGERLERNFLDVTIMDNDR
jgi:hypothetical protein